MAITKKTSAGKDTEGQDKPSHTTHGNAAGTTEITRLSTNLKTKMSYMTTPFLNIYNPWNPRQAVRHKESRLSSEKHLLCFLSTDIQLAQHLGQQAPHFYSSSSSRGSGVSGALQTTALTCRCTHLHIIKNKLF